MMIRFFATRMAAPRPASLRATKEVILLISRFLISDYFKLI
jgi:hypothetical protein